MIATANADAAKMLVIEGVYSMEGHIARLPELAEIADENGCFTVVDDAHGFGVLGRQGRGTVDNFGLNDKVDVICGSLSKSLASTGGFVAASQEIIDYLRTHSKQTVFSAAISPSQAACAQKAKNAHRAKPTTTVAAVPAAVGGATAGAGRRRAARNTRMDQTRKLPNSITSASVLLAMRCAKAQTFTDNVIGCCSLALKWLRGT